MLVLSIGVLGLAGLQITSTRYGFDSQLRTLSMFNANEIINSARLRTFKVSDADRETAIANLTGTDPSTCDPTSATVDSELACWKQRISKELPQGTGNLIDNGDGTFTVEISWYDRQTEAEHTSSWVVKGY